MLRRSTKEARKEEWGRCVPFVSLWTFANILPFPFIEHAFLPHYAEFLATRCRMTPPTLCYQPPCGHSAPQSFICQPVKHHFPAAVDYLPFEPVVAILPSHSSPISIRYPECLGLFVFATHSLRGHVGKLPSNVSRFDEHNEKPASLLVQ